MSAQPNDEMETLITELKKYEQLGESAYGTMYEAKPYLVKDCYDDARSSFTKAIDAAKRAGLDDEVTRLTTRRDHIIKVYNNQFRGVGY